jgi:hypothetical protein
MDEIMVGIAGERMCLWPAVDHEGGVLDMLVQRRRNTRSARRRTIGETPLRQNDRRPCFIPVFAQGNLIWQCHAESCAALGPK